MPYASSVAALTLASDLSRPCRCAVRLCAIQLDGCAHCCALLSLQLQPCHSSHNSTAAIPRATAHAWRAPRLFFRASSR